MFFYFPAVDFTEGRVRIFFFQLRRCLEKVVVDAVFWFYSGSVSCFTLDVSSARKIYLVYSIRSRCFLISHDNDE